jgi:hypothetical protein
MILTKYRSIEISNNDITSKVPEGLMLNDIVLIFNYEGQWIAIPLTTLTKYPIIYLLNTETKEYGSIICCLLTLRSMYVFEKVRWIGYNGLKATFNNEAGEITDFENKLDKDGEKLVEFKRSQTKFQSLRSALIEYGDIKYINLNLEHKKNLIPIDYYKNLTDYEENEITVKDFHPKTLCTLIQYVSDTNVTKTTIVVGRQLNKKNIDESYDPKKNKIYEYLAESGEKLIEKKAFIMNILYYTAKTLFPDVKYIYI